MFKENLELGVCFAWECLEEFVKGVEFENA